MNTANATLDRQLRIKGGVAGLLIGDALGVGPHWYYNLDELKQDFGPWIDTYQDPVINGSHHFASISKLRYEQGVRAGDGSQTGQVITLLLESLASNRGFSLEDFLARLDDFFTTLSGEPFSGRYTDSMMVDLIQHRRSGHGWNELAVASDSDTSEGAQLVALLALFIADPLELATVSEELLIKLYREPFIRQNSIVFALVVQAMVNDVSLKQLPAYLSSLVHNPGIMRTIARYDNVVTPTVGQVAWHCEHVRIEPALYVSHVYGMDCQLTHLLPSAYYLMHRFAHQFDQGVLSAINGGGNNMARAALTGVLLGAMNGTPGIPEQLLSGLNRCDYYLMLAEKTVAG